MPNPLWISGGKSPNPGGRPKASIRTPQGMILNWLSGKLKKKELDRLYELLKPDKQADLITRFAQLVLTRPGEMSKEEYDVLYDKIKEKIDEAVQSKKAI